MNIIIPINNSISSSNSILLSSSEKKKYSLEMRIAENAMLAFEEFSHIWAYGGKSLIVLRNFLNATAHSCSLFIKNSRCFNTKIAKTVTRLKLFSIVSVPINTASIPEKGREILKSVRLGDSEGMLISGLGLSLLATDIVDSLATFINASWAMLSKPAIAWMSVFGTPLTLALLVQGSISRSIRLYNLAQFSKKLQKQVLLQLESSEKDPQKIRSALQTFLETTMRIEGPETQIKELQEAILKRHTNKKIVSLLQELNRWTLDRPNFSAEDFTHLSEVIDEVMKSLEKDCSVQHMGLVANFINLTALAAFYTSIPLTIPYLLLTTGFSLRIVAQAYQDFFN